MNSAAYTLNDHHDTENLGRQIAMKFTKRPGLIFLRGEMGAGKTTFAQGFITQLLKRQEIITSPTYSYVNTYKHMPPIYHFDLYRINHSEEIFELGLEALIEDENAIRLVEWPEKIVQINTIPDLEINLNHTKSGRSAQISWRK